MSGKSRHGKVFGPADLKRLEGDRHVGLCRIRGNPEGIQRRKDHVHLLVNYPSKARLSELVNSLKGVSSRRMKRPGVWPVEFGRSEFSRSSLWEGLAELFRDGGLARPSTAALIVLDRRRASGDVAFTKAVEAHIESRWD